MGTSVYEINASYNATRNLAYETLLVLMLCEGYQPSKGLVDTLQDTAADSSNSLVVILSKFHHIRCYTSSYK